MHYTTVADQKIDTQQKSGFLNSLIYLFIHFKVCVEARSGLPTKKDMIMLPSPALGKNLTTAYTPARQVLHTTEKNNTEKRRIEHRRYSSVRAASVIGFPLSPLLSASFQWDGGRALAHLLTEWLTIVFHPNT